MPLPNGSRKHAAERRRPLASGAATASSAAGSPIGSMRSLGSDPMLAAGREAGAPLGTAVAGGASKGRSFASCRAGSACTAHALRIGCRRTGPACCAFAMRVHQLLLAGPPCALRLKISAPSPRHSHRQARTAPRASSPRGAEPTPRRAAPSASHPAQQPYVRRGAITGRQPVEWSPRGLGQPNQRPAAWSARRPAAAPCSLRHRLQA